MIEIIDVTDDNIVNGKKKCPGSCPIAKALGPVLAKKVMVREIHTEVGHISFKHGPKLRKWIKNFDNYHRFHNPFKLTIDYTNKTIEICA